jgi:hypothetical protein
MKQALGIVRTDEGMQIDSSEQPENAPLPRSATLQPVSNVTDKTVLQRLKAF